MYLCSYIIKKLKLELINKFHVILSFYLAAEDMDLVIEARLIFQNLFWVSCIANILC